MLDYPESVLSLQVFRGIMWGGFALCVILFMCRIVIRVSCFGRPFVEDYLMFAALVLFLASTIISQVLLQYIYQALDCLYLTEGTCDIHGTQTTDKATAGVSSVTYINYVSIWLVKLNFMLFFRRLGNHVPKYRITWWVVLLFNVIAGAMCIGYVAVDCFTSSSDFIMTECMDAGAEDINITVSVSLDAAGDLLIMAFPIWILWGTKVSARKKTVLSAIFGLVTVTIAVTIVRGTVYGGVTGIEMDPIRFWFWFDIEFIAAFMVGCLISFRSLFTHREKAARELNNHICRQPAPLPASNAPRGLRARARVLQQELLTTFTAWEDTRGASEDGLFLNSYCPPSGRLSVDFQQDYIRGEAASSPSGHSAFL